MLYVCAWHRLYNETEPDTSYCFTHESRDIYEVMGVDERLMSHGICQTCAYRMREEVVHADGGQFRNYAM